MREETLAQRLAKRNISLGYWAKNRGLSEQDRYLLRKLSNGTTRGTSKGRTKELVEMLRADGLLECAG